MISDYEISKFTLQDLQNYLTTEQYELSSTDYNDLLSNFWSSVNRLRCKATKKKLQSYVDHLDTEATMYYIRGVTRNDVKYFKLYEKLSKNAEILSTNYEIYRNCKLF